MAARLRLTAGVPTPRGLRAWLHRYGEALLAVASVDPAADLSVVLTDDATIRGLNRQHLGHDGPTDVLSFALAGDDFPRVGRSRPLFGELIVSLPTAERQAAGAGHSLRAELAHLVVHGLLHLLGYDHDSIVAARRMEAAEAHTVRAALARLRPGDAAGIAVPHTAPGYTGHAG